MAGYWLIYHVGSRGSLFRLSEHVWQKGWWDGYAEDVERQFVDFVWLESRATEIRVFENTLCPGLLQISRLCRGRDHRCRMGAIWAAFVGGVKKGEFGLTSTTH